MSENDASYQTLTYFLFIAFVVSRLSKCKCMDSKMKPLWLVWKNADNMTGSTDNNIYIMYKKGDGK